MATRVCVRCGDSKDTEEFAWKSKARGRRHPHCKTCQSKVSARHYQHNREDYISRAQGRYSVLRVQNEGRLATWFEGKRCSRCPESNPDKLEFAHREGQIKKGTVKRLLGQSWEIILAEIAKCDLVCTSCRRKKKFV